MVRVDLEICVRVVLCVLVCRGLDVVVMLSVHGVVCVFAISPGRFYFCVICSASLITDFFFFN